MLVNALRAHLAEFGIVAAQGWPMSAPVLLGYAESGDYTERKKDRTQNKVTPTPGEACAEERQGGEQSKVACLGVHSRSRLERGSDQAAP